MRKRGRTRSFAAFAAACSVACLAAAVAIPVTARAHISVAGELVIGLFFLAAATLGAVLARRLLKAALRLDRVGVEIRGPLETWSFTLAEVESFVPGVQDGTGKRPDNADPPVRGRVCS